MITGACRAAKQERMRFRRMNGNGSNALLTRRNTFNEIQQSMSDDTLTVCPSCGESTLRKLFNNVGVVFKGSGFYKTDNRSSSGSSGGGSSSGGVCTRRRASTASSMLPPPTS